VGGASFSAFEAEVLRFETAGAGSASIRNAAPFVLAAAFSGGVDASVIGGLFDQAAAGISDALELGPYSPARPAASADGAPRADPPRDGKGTSTDCFICVFS
jgi:hypothetical protein